MSDAEIARLKGALQAVAETAVAKDQECRRLTAEIERLRAATQWRPIETAPKDELILVGPTKRMGICAAMYHSRDGWVTETCSDWVPIHTPTHWMPLPPAPKEVE